MRQISRCLSQYVWNERIFAASMMSQLVALQLEPWAWVAWVVGFLNKLRPLTPLPG
jgi:hypothetical protein